MKRAFDYVVLTAVMMFVLLSGAKTMALTMPFSRSSDTVLIVPARPGVLQLAFDFAKMRAISIVSFRAQASPEAPPRQGKANADKPLLHVWTGNDWQYVSFDDFCSLRFIAPAPKTAIVIGDDQIVPKALLQDLAWPCKIERLPTINAADLINGMDPYFKFSSREWKRLADSYGLKLEDVNAPKRAFNPYNIPRSKLPLETHDFRPEKSEAPPAVLIEKSGVQTESKDSKQTEKPWIK